MSERGLDPADIAYLVHGTTIAINTVIQRNGASLGLLVTAGSDCHGPGRIKSTLGSCTVTQEELEALRRAPHNAALHFSVGLLFRELDRLRESVTHFREAVRLRPTHPDSLLNLGVGGVIKSGLALQHLA